MRIFTKQLLGLALTGLILSSCSQTATFEDADLMNEQAADKSGAKLTPLGTGDMNAMVLTGGGNYLINCITDVSADAYKATGSLSGQWGGPDGDKFSKTLNVQVWNTLTTIEYRFLATGDGGNLQFYDETLLPNPGWVAAGALTSGVVKSISRPLPSGWTAGDIVTEQWRQTGDGSPLGGTAGTIAENGIVSYALIGICTTTTLVADVDISAPICEDTPVLLTAAVSSFGTFTGGTIEIRDSNGTVATQAVSVGDKDVTFSVPTENEGIYTYTAHYVGAGSNGYNNSQSSPLTVTVIECEDDGCDEKFNYVDNGDNAAYVFTYTPAEDVSGATLVFTFAQGVAESATGLDGWATNGSTRQITMDLVACQEYTWTVDLTPDCSGSSANSNVWTDFKVNGYSKKNVDTPTITESCPS